MTYNEALRIAQERNFEISSPSKQTDAPHAVTASVYVESRLVKQTTPLNDEPGQTFERARELAVVSAVEGLVKTLLAESGPQ